MRLQGRNYLVGETSRALKSPPCMRENSGIAMDQDSGNRIQRHPVHHFGYPGKTIHRSIRSRLLINPRSGFHLYRNTCSVPSEQHTGTENPGQVSFQKLFGIISSYSRGMYRLIAEPFTYKKGKVCPNLFCKDVLLH